MQLHRFWRMSNFLKNVIVGMTIYGDTSSEDYFSTQKKPDLHKLYMKKQKNDEFEAEVLNERVE